MSSSKSESGYHPSKIDNAANPPLFFDTDSFLIDGTNAIE
jgi:hypothetical protein